MLIGIDDGKTNVRLGPDLIVFQPAHIYDKKNVTRRAVRPCVKRASAKTILETRREHPYGRTFKNFPDAVAVHTRQTAIDRDGS
jgi:hypothetical protein